MSKIFNFDSLSDSPEASKRLKSPIFHGEGELIQPSRNIGIDDNKNSFIVQPFCKGNYLNFSKENNGQLSLEGHIDQKSSQKDKDQEYDSQNSFQDTYYKLVNKRENCHLHFMNSCRLESSVYSCAIDSFLEIAYSTFGPYIAEIEIQSLFFDLITKCLKSYSIILSSDNRNDRSKEQNLSDICLGFFSCKLHIFCKS